MPNAKEEIGNPRNFWVSVVLIALIIPFVFWLRFGRVDGFAIAFAVFLVMIVGGVRFLPGLSERYRNDTTVNNVKPSWFDRLGVVWLLSIPFAPFASWCINEYFLINVNNWSITLAITTGLCVALPCICVLPLTRYLRGRSAPVAALILAIGTLFPVIIGWNSMTDLIQGPVEQPATVSAVTPVYYYRNGRQIATDVLEVTLDDGQKLTADKKWVAIRPGQSTLTILKNKMIVISAR